MKIRLVIGILLFCITGGTRADRYVPNTYLYGGFHSEYVGNDGVVLSTGPVTQDGVVFAWANGAYVGLWGSVPFRSGNNNDYGKEVDVSVGWSGHVWLFNANVTFSHYNLHPVGRINSRDVVSVIGEVSPRSPWQIGETSLTPYLKLEALNSSGNGIKNATQVFVGLNSRTPIGNNWTLEQKVQLGHQPKFPGLSSGWNGYYQLNVTHTFSNGLTVGPEFRRYQPLGLDGGRKGENVFGVTFGYSFR
jgi:hypothetical protein